jgi:uncharacterized protein
MTRRQRWRDGTGTLVLLNAEQAQAQEQEQAQAQAQAQVQEQAQAHGQGLGRAPAGRGPDEGAGAGETRAGIPVEIAATHGSRRRGLLGRDGIEGALLLTPCNSVHTFRMRFPIDIAYLARDLTVVSVHTLPPGRLPLPRLRARHVLESEAGAMAGWGLRVGVRVEIHQEGAG